MAKTKFQEWQGSRKWVANLYRNGQGGFVYPDGSSITMLDHRWSAVFEQDELDTTDLGRAEEWLYKKLLVEYGVVEDNPASVQRCLEDSQ